MASPDSSQTTHPRPYTRKELLALRTTLDERWPKLTPDEAERWLTRVKDGRSPYSRVRVHAIRCQLEAVIALALHLGLRRSEIWRASVADLHYYNAGAIARRIDAKSPEAAREAPWTSGAWEACRDWLDCRSQLGATHDRPWLSLHSAATMRDAMTEHTFHRLLLTYVGPGWTLKRLRDTCGAAWVRSDLSLEHLRQLLGLRSIEATLPYARLVRGSLDGRMEKLDTLFTGIVTPAEVAA
jgi:integrase